MKPCSFARLTALLMVLLVACSQINIQSTSGYPETMSVWITWETNPARFQAMFDRFGEAHDTLIEVTPLVYADKVMRGLTGNEPPDILVVGGPDYVGTWARQGLLTALDDVIADNGIDLGDVYPATLKQCEYLGKYYCLPWGTDTYALYWNKDLFRAAGLHPNRPPETLEELEAYSRELTRLDENGNITQLGFLPDVAWSHIELYASMFGGYWYNGDATRLTLSSQPMVDALNWQQQFYTQYGTEAVLQFALTFGDYASPDHPFLAGKVAMAVDGEWMVGPDFIQKYRPDLNYGVAPFPYPASQPERKNTNVVQGTVVMIPASVQDVQAAGELLAWMTGPAILAEVMCQNFNLPTSRQAAEDPCFRENQRFRVFMDLMSSPNATGLSFTTISSDLYAELERVEGLVLHEGADPLPLLQEAEARLQPMLDEALRETGERE